MPRTVIPDRDAVVAEITVPTPHCLRPSRATLDYCAGGGVVQLLSR